MSRSFSILTFFLALFAAQSLGQGQINGENFLGCYRDSGSDRDLPVALAYGYVGTPSVCNELCANANFLYFGLQFGGECWCGNDYGRYGYADCDMPCVADPTYWCGGYLANSVHQVTPLDPCAPNQGVTVNGQCACYSGNLGSDCSVFQASSCALPTAPPLKTQAVAEFMSSLSSISSGNLQFVIHSPATSRRYFDVISLNNAAACSYPSNHFTKSFLVDPDCKDVFTGTFSVPELVQTCGFTESTEPGYTVFSGKVFVSAVDEAGNLRGHAITRSTSSSLDLEVRLPNFHNLSSSSIEVLSPIAVLASIRRQHYDSLSDLATIEISTSVQTYYRLVSASISQSQAGLSITTEVSEGFCDQIDCFQTITLTISGAQQAGCSFSGGYSLDLNYRCNNGPCPTEETLTTNLAFELTSEHVCAQVEVTGTVDGVLAGYQDGSFSVVSPLFVANRLMFFKASLTTDVEIQSIGIHELRLIQGGATTILLQNDIVLPPYDASLSFTRTDLNTNEVGFSFLAKYGDEEGALFSSSLIDATFTFTLEADLDIVYRTTFGKKRDVQQTKLILSSNNVLMPSMN